MSALHPLQARLSDIEKRLGVIFKNKQLLILAFVHRSFVNEHRDVIDQHNERLEFLGDSVLGLVTSDYVYRRLPVHPEGVLSQLRSRLVDASACAKYLEKMQLADCILLGKGERVAAKQVKSSILADVFEALVGAIYLDSGYDIAAAFITSHFTKEIEETIGRPPRNYKADLQDYSQKHYQKPPTYKIMQEEGPDHAKIFQIAVFVDDRQLGAGAGSSKKEAEQQAALQALAKIEKLHSYTQKY
jgi:ribonuclease-3